MSRGSRERLLDIIASCEAIAAHLQRVDLDEGLVFDAIRIRLVEIGEAVKDLGPAIKNNEGQIPWSEIARMRDMLTHRYFDTAHSIVLNAARNDVPQLEAAARRLLAAI